MYSGISSFFLAMAMHPSTQQKAQAEIDSVCDSQRRLPTFADKASLPYVEALVLEVLRWSAITPLGLPHRFTEDVEYQGLRFRKDMHAFANIALVVLLDALCILWLTHRPCRAISFDPELYPEPESFRPERFLGPTPHPDPRKIVFGYGRRFVGCSSFQLLVTYHVSAAYAPAPRLQSKSCSSSSRPPSRRST